MNGFFSGFWLSLSLILAIGAQNAFVLKQGLRRAHVPLICVICALSDALLIIAGVAGFAVLLAAAPWVEPAARYGGALFLFGYGIRCFYTAARRHDTLTPQGGHGGAGAAAAACLAFTWLNPHVYLDTLVLLGSISTQYPGEKVQFAGGACAASFCFFFALGYGARLLAPWLARAVVWRILEFCIGCVMWYLAAQLTWGGISIAPQ